MTEPTPLLKALHELDFATACSQLAPSLWDRVMEEVRKVRTVEAVTRENGEAS